MSESEKPDRWYSFVGAGPYRPPDYARVVRYMSDLELRSDLAAGRGDAGYQDAARAELARRESTEGDTL